MEKEKDTMIIDDEALEGVNGGAGRNVRAMMFCKDCNDELVRVGLNYKCPSCSTLYDPAGNKINTSRITKAT